MITQKMQNSRATNRRGCENNPDSYDVYTNSYQLYEAPHPERHLESSTRCTNINSNTTLWVPEDHVSDFPGNIQEHVWNYKSSGFNGYQSKLYLAKLDNHLIGNKQVQNIIDYANPLSLSLQQGDSNSFEQKIGKTKHSSGGHPKSCVADAEYRVSVRPIHSDYTPVAFYHPNEKHAYANVTPQDNIGGCITPDDKDPVNGNKDHPNENWSENYTNAIVHRTLDATIPYQPASPSDSTTTKCWSNLRGQSASGGLSLEKTDNCGACRPNYGAGCEKDGATRQKKGFVVPGIIFLKKLGSGGFSEVYLSVDESSRKFVVCKRTKISSVRSWKYHPVYREKVPHELCVLERLKRYSKYFVELHGFVKTYNECLIMMNYLGEEWVDMYDYLCKGGGPQSNTQIKEIFGRVLDAVHFLHACGMSHNDIKDENILINTRTREIKLIDFGSASEITQASLTPFYGTKRYASPQVLRSMPYSQVLQESWALGVLLFVISFKLEPFSSLQDVMSMDIYFIISNARVTFSQRSNGFYVTDDIVDAMAGLLHKEERLRKTFEDIRNSEVFKPYRMQYY